MFHNEISDYIYLSLTDVEIDESGLAVFSQQDATFSGLEAQLTIPVWQGKQSHLDVSFSGDFVSARFDSSQVSGKYIPRIPPSKVAMELAWLADVWRIKLRYTDVQPQENVANFETETSGYSKLDLYAEYRLSQFPGDLSVFLKGSNLLDEDIRNHSSFIKHFAPEGGRGLELGLRALF